MNKLLSANFARLKKNKMFLGFTIISIIFALVFIIYPIKNSKNFLMYNTFDDLFFAIVQPIGFFIAIFTSMFIGTEHSDGTLKNKIIMGKTRISIYMSNVITAFFVSVSFTLMFMGITLIGYPFLGGFALGISNTFIGILVTITIIASFTAIFTFIAMLCSNKTITLLISIVLFIALMMFSQQLVRDLMQPEMITAFFDETSQQVLELDPYPNPYYVDEPLRTIHKYIVDIMPTGQTFTVTSLEITNPIRMIVLSTLSAISITFLGIFIFNKKDLK